MIYWGKLEFDETPQRDEPSEAYADPDLELAILDEYEPFCEAWEIPIPGRAFSSSPRNASHYSLCRREVTLSVAHAKFFADKAVALETPNKLLISKRITLFHELTHAVQHRMKGEAWMQANALLCEAHADVFSGYWLAKDFTEEIYQLIGPIAFAKGGTVEDGTHPPGCLRERAYREGNAMGLQILALFGDLKVGDSSREELFRDSLETAARILHQTPKPCDHYRQRFAQGQVELCETCPKAKAPEVIEARNTQKWLGDLASKERGGATQ